VSVEGPSVTYGMALVQIRTGSRDVRNPASGAGAGAAYVSPLDQPNTGSC
jgi:hypothetical protein